MAFELLKQRHSYALGVVVILPERFPRFFESGVCVRARGEVFLVIDRKGVPRTSS